MNIRKMAESLGMNEDEFLEMVTLFIEVSTTDLDKFTSAVATGDATAAADAVHSIKGAAGSLRFTDLFELAKEIEQNARSGLMADMVQSGRSLKTRLDEIAGLMAVSK